MASSNISGVRAALDRLEQEGLIPRASFGSAGYATQEQMIGVTVAEVYSYQRHNEIRDLIISALPDDAKDITVNVIFKG